MTDIVCEVCGEPGRIFRVTPGYVTPGTEHLSGPNAMCDRHAAIRQREIWLHGHPKGYEFALREEKERIAELLERKAAGREGAGGKAKPFVSEREEAKLVDAAVQRLMGEAKRLDDANPNTRSPAWVGRDLEVEGWSRKVLIKALARAIEDGDLVIEEIRDERRNRKRAVRPAPTGVAVEIFA